MYEFVPRIKGVERRNDLANYNWSVLKECVKWCDHSIAHLPRYINRIKSDMCD
jgi:hypothetical protein